MIGLPNWLSMMFCPGTKWHSPLLNSKLRQEKSVGIPKYRVGAKLQYDHKIKYKGIYRSWKTCF